MDFSKFPCSIFYKSQYWFSLIKLKSLCLFVFFYKKRIIYPFIRNNSNNKLTISLESKDSLPSLSECILVVLSQLPFKLGCCPLPLQLLMALIISSRREEGGSARISVVIDKYRNLLVIAVNKENTKQFKGHFQSHKNSQSNN